MNCSAFFIAFTSKREVEQLITNFGFPEIQVCEGTYYTEDEFAVSACLVYVENDKDSEELIGFGEELRKSTFCSTLYLGGEGNKAWFISVSPCSYFHNENALSRLCEEMPLLEVFVPKEKENQIIMALFEQNECTWSYSEALSGWFEFDSETVLNCSSLNLGR